MQLLTHLGLDTGYSNTNETIQRRAHCGMEKKLSDELPYIIKGPGYCKNLRELVSLGHRVDRLIVPMRDLFAAAESRRDIFRKRGLLGPGGLFGTDKPEDQERALAENLYGLFLAAAEFDIPVTLLLYPHLVRHPLYLYRKLKWLLGKTDFATFKESFRAVARPSFVHDYKPVQAQLGINPE